MKYKNLAGLGPMLLAAVVWTGSALAGGIPTVNVVAIDSEASELGLETGTFQFSRVGGNSSLNISFNESGSTASNGSDYTAHTGVVTIPANENTVTFVVQPIADNRFEGTEVVVFNINNSGSYNIGTNGTAQVSIADDPAVVEVTATDAEANELGLETGEFQYTRSGGDLTSALTVSFNESGSTASNGSDYQSHIGNVTIPANETQTTFTVQPIADNRFEGTEVVIFNLNTSSAYDIGAGNTAQVAIADDPAIVDIAATDPEADELGLETGEFQYTRSGGDLTSALTVSFNESGSTASNGSDYQSHIGNVTIPANETQTTFTVQPIADNRFEGTEVVIFNLNTSSAYDIGAGNTAQVAIADDPAIVDIAATDPEADELGLETGEFQYTRSGGDLMSALTVSFNESGSTASNGGDYQSHIGNVTIPANETQTTFTVQPIADNRFEGTELVVFNLNTSSAYDIGAGNTAQVAIADDPAVVEVTATDAEANELGLETGEFQYTRNGGDLTSALTVSFNESGSTASNGSDYQSHIGNVTIPADETQTIFTVQPIADNRFEGTEVVVFNLNTSSAYDIGAGNTAQVSIVDDPAVAAVSAIDISADEMTGDTGIFTFIRSGGDLSQALTVSFNESGSTASNGSDYVSHIGNLTWGPNETCIDFYVEPIPDTTENEQPERVRFTINSSGSYAVSDWNTAQVWITEDEEILMGTGFEELYCLDEDDD